MHILAKKLVVEFIDAFFLVFAIGISSGDLAPFAITGVLIAMIFAGAHISGAHYNPAVTVSLFLRGSAPVREVFPYGLAIGFVIFGGMILVGPVSGAVFNPAVAAGLFVRSATDLSMLGLYTAASLAGGVAAAFVFLFTKGEK
ncbi:MAG: hypothetical protein GKS04_05395 [Candidatus Mycalebacterium zealandia]|nr:MAG: hypothetical protein GKS04_05395 [Candidatus Mycalebacterium zealandia]